MKELQGVKSGKKKPPVQAVEVPVWCEKCRIRVAPYDKKTVLRGKTYHTNCFNKLVEKSKVLSVASQSQRN